MSTSPVVIERIAVDLAGAGAMVAVVANKTTTAADMAGAGDMAAGLTLYMPLSAGMAGVGDMAVADIVAASPDQYREHRDNLHLGQRDGVLGLRAEPLTALSLDALPHSLALDGRRHGLQLQASAHSVYVKQL